MTRASRPGEPGAHSIEGIDDQRLRWYPRQWRARYGDELAALLDEEYGDHLPVSARFGLVTGGLRQRARASGLAGDSVPAPERVRAGALVVLAAWIAFVVAGGSFAKLSEHFDEALPHAMETHRLPDLAFLVVQITAGVASILVAVGSAPRAPCLRAVPASGRLAPVARAPPAGARGDCSDGRGHGTPPRVGPPPYVAATKRWCALVRGLVSAVGGPDRPHVDVVDRRGDRGGQTGAPLQADARGGIGPCRGCRCRNGGHGHRHCGLVGCDGAACTCVLQRSSGQQLSFTVGLAPACHRCRDGARDRGGRGRGDARDPRLVAHASRLIHSGQASLLSSGRTC